MRKCAPSPTVARCERICHGFDSEARLEFTSSDEAYVESLVVYSSHLRETSRCLRRVHGAVMGPQVEGRLGLVGTQSEPGFSSLTESTSAQHRRFTDVDSNAQARNLRTPDDLFVAAAALFSVRGERSSVEENLVVVIDDRNGRLARRAAKCGVEAILVEDKAADVAVQLAIRQLRELKQLRLEQARLGVIERAKGVLMERHQLPESKAHQLLQRHARNSNLKLVDVADAVIESHILLSEIPDQEASVGSLR
jgi:hypothetical protein